MPKLMLTLTLVRKTTNTPWGFSLAGGSDQGLTHKIGTIREESIADLAGLSKMDYLWTVNGKAVFGLSHKECAKLIRESGLRLELVVERGDHIVPSFQELWQNKPGRTVHKQNRNLTGIAYYLDAMQDHGLPGKIPPKFTTCGKPFYLENNQYNSPIEVYNDTVIEEMVKTMDIIPPRVNQINSEPETGQLGGRVVSSCRPVKPVGVRLVRTISDEMEKKWKF